MKNKWSEEEIIKQYIESENIIYNLAGTTNYKRHNKEVDKLIKIYKYLEKDMELAKRVFYKLLNNKDIKIKLWIAAHCLGLQIYTKEAEKILEEIAKKSSLPLTRFTAKATLEVWHKNGKLKMYSDKS